MTDSEREETLRRKEILRHHVDRELTAEEAADRPGPRAQGIRGDPRRAAASGRLPDQRDAFTEGEAHRAREMLGLA